jgi:FkbM family methyltransferase
VSEVLEACDIPGRGYSLFLPPPEQRDEFQKFVAAGGNWDYTQEMLIALTDDGDTILDLGANIGTITLPVARAGRRVVAYELLPQNARAITLAAKANGLEDRITVRNGAVWDEPGQTYFAGHSAWGQVASEGQAIDRIVVDDDLRDPSEVRAVKIDVEGSELRALRGMRRLLGDHHPSVLFEGNVWTLAQHEVSVFDVVKLLQSLGFAVYRINRGHVLTPWGADIQPAICVDYLATTMPEAEVIARTGFTVRSLSNDEYAAVVVDYGIYSRVTRSYVSLIAKILPQEILDHPISTELIDGAIQECRGGAEEQACSRGYGRDFSRALPKET